MSISCCGEETGEEGKPKQRRQLPYAAKNGGRISRRRVATQSRINECEGGWRFTSSTAASQHRWWRQKVAAAEEVRGVKAILGCICFHHS
ncbi:unnamed protein product [Lactuca virosa]|uniref:Uncharacterized protein n=1 Tax=Lactuca virosa TaxID=75947 RepID=A0AAU9NGG9_9ASTR|nr:unnamed protein product [Lactuca virosa]